MSHFLRGLVEADGEPFRLEDGAPACRGTGIAKEDTIRSIIEKLKAIEFVTVFKGTRGTITPANVYMPLSERWLAGYTLNAGLGVLPDHIDDYWIDEHVWWQNVPCRVVGYAGHGVRLREIKRWDEMVGPIVPAPVCGLRRMTLSEWSAMKK